MALAQTQHFYTVLLWNYLTYRHGDLEAIRILSNLNAVYLRMQRTSQAVNREIRTRSELATVHEAFHRAVVIDADAEQ